jgi:NADH-quinone oxidoreductase subunit L
MIIEAVRYSQLPYADWVYIAVIAGVFITAFYSFRMFFMVFHGQSRVDKHTESHLHESPWSITIPLIALAIPSAFIGFYTIEPMLFTGWLESAIIIDPSHTSMEILKSNFISALELISHSIVTWPFWMMFLGVVTAWVFSLYRTEWADWIKNKFKGLNYILESLYGFDRLNEIFFVNGFKRLGEFFWKVTDAGFIDKTLVNGSAKLAGFFGSLIRPIQTGFVYHYAFFMILSLLFILTWVLYSGENPLLGLPF